MKLKTNEVSALAFKSMSEHRLLFRRDVRELSALGIDCELIKEMLSYSYTELLECVKQLDDEIIARICEGGKKDRQ